MRTIPIYSDEVVKNWWSFLDWATVNLAEGTSVAVKDHGRLAYFTDTRVIDLAGIIEPAMIDYLARGRIGDYLLARDAQYALLPREGGRSVYVAIRDQVPLAPMTGVPEQEATGYILYRIER